MCILTVRFLSPPPQFLETGKENTHFNEHGYQKASPFGKFLLVNAFLHEAFNRLPYRFPGVSAIWALLRCITVEQMFQNNHPVCCICNTFGLQFKRETRLYWHNPLSWTSAGSSSLQYMKGLQKIKWRSFVSREGVLINSVCLKKTITRGRRVWWNVVQRGHLGKTLLTYLLSDMLFTLTMENN